MHETVAECMIFANHWLARKLYESLPSRALVSCQQHLPQSHTCRPIGSRVSYRGGNPPYAKFPLPRLIINNVFYIIIIIKFDKQQCMSAA